MPRTSPFVAECSKDIRRLQAQKFRNHGGVEARMLMALATYFGEHFVSQSSDLILTRPVIKDEDRNKLWLVFNLIKRVAKRKMGRLWSARYEYTATPNIREPHAYDKAKVVTDLNRGLDRRLKERRQHWNRIWWTTLTGVCIEHIPWIENIDEEPLPKYDEASGELVWREAQTGQEMIQSQVEQIIEQFQIPPERFSVVQELTTCGNVGSQIISGLQFLIDASVPTIDALGPDQACYILELKTKGWIKQIFGADAAAAVTSKVGANVGIIRSRFGENGPVMNGVNLQDLVPALQGSRTIDDPEMAIIATRYQPANEEYPHGRRTILVPDQIALDDGDIQYGEIPCVDFHFDAQTTSFWSPDFITDILPANKFLNKRMSQLGEMSNAQIYELLLLGGSLSKEDIPSDKAGVVEGGLDENGTELVKAMQHAAPPAFFLESIKLVTELIERLGMSDITGHAQYPGQLRGPLAIPILQELIDSEDGPLFEHFGEQLALVKQQRVNRVRQFYPPIRTLRYTGRGKRDEVLIFHADEILRSGVDYEISVDQGTIMPKLSALHEAQIIERLSGPLAGLYVDRRTGKIDFSKVALALRFGDDDREDRESQYRQLAMHLIGRLWEAEVLPPDIPYAFWDHSVMLDELESAMATTEFLESSPQTKQGFIDLYERTRAFLAAIQESQTNAIQSQMMQGAVAQATQQAAAKAASYATDAALGQVDAQAQMTRSRDGAQAGNPDIQHAGNAVAAAQSRGDARRPPRGPEDTRRTNRPRSRPGSPE